MGENLCVTLTLEPRGPAGAFVLAGLLSHGAGQPRWVNEAKRDATRAQRVAKTVEMLRAGQHR